MSTVSSISGSLLDYPGTRIKGFQRNLVPGTRRLLTGDLTTIGLSSLSLLTDKLKPNFKHLRGEERDGEEGRSKEASTSPGSIRGIMSVWRDRRGSSNYLLDIIK